MRFYLTYELYEMHNFWPHKSLRMERPGKKKIQFLGLRGVKERMILSQSNIGTADSNPAWDIEVYP
jgi:hypothetical protein